MHGPIYIALSLSLSLSLSRYFSRGASQGQRARFVGAGPAEKRQETRDDRRSPSVQNPTMKSRCPSAPMFILGHVYLYENKF